MNKYFRFSMNLSGQITKDKRLYKGAYDLGVSMNPERLEARDALNRLIEKRIIVLEDVPCLCGGERFSLLATHDRYGVKQQTVICNLCGLIQGMPRMNESSSKQFYESDHYRKLYTPRLYNSDPDYIVKQAELGPTKRFEFIKKNTDYAHINNILEIGCGGGWNLYPFYKDGKTVVGLDYGPQLVSLGKKLGMDLRVGSIEILEPTEKFDLIILRHVIEHFSEPVALMRKISKLLSPTGVLYIEVPNITHFVLSALVSAHNYYFTKPTFLHYMQKAGLSARSYWTENKLTPAQGAIFSPSSEMPINLSNEFERMKTLIEKEENAKDRKEMVKSILKKFGGYEILRRLLRRFR